MSIDFQRAVIREFDQICQRFEATITKVEKRFEQAVEKLEERDESRDGEVSDLKLQVGLLRSECRRNLKRDAGLVLAPTTLTAIITAVLGQFGHPAAASPTPPGRCGDAIVQVSERCDDGVNDGRPGTCLPGCQGWGRVAP